MRSSCFLISRSLTLAAPWVHFNYFRAAFFPLVNTLSSVGAFKLFVYNIKSESADKPGSVLNNHLSGTNVTVCLKQSTRTAYSAGRHIVKTCGTA